MSETIIGVITGGIIASIVPLVTLFFNHRQWKREAKLAHLKSERARLEKLYEDTLRSLAEAMAQNSYPSQMTADIFVLMPKEVTKRFWDFMEDKDKTEQKSKEAYLEIALSMRRSIAQIDESIMEMVS